MSLSPSSFPDLESSPPSSTASTLPKPRTARRKVLCIPLIYLPIFIFLPLLIVLIIVLIAVFKKPSPRDSPRDPSVDPCHLSVDPCDPSVDHFPTHLVFRHAKTIHIIRHENTYVEFSIAFEKQVFNYRLVKAECPIPEFATVDEKAQVVFTQPKSVYVDDGPILALFEAVQPKLDSLKFVNYLGYIFSPAIRNLVDTAAIQQLDGKGEGKANYTVLQEDDEFALAFLGAARHTEEKPASQVYKDAAGGKKFVVVGEQWESSALGRAEWVKVMGLVMGELEKAKEVFTGIEQRYNEVKKIASTLKKRDVFFNEAFGESWTQPGGGSYMASLVRDANGGYVYENDSDGLTKFLSYEEIGKQFEKTEFLVNTGKWPNSNNRSLEDFVEDGGEDRKEVYGILEAVKCGRVWSSQKRISEDGLANDLFEGGALNADLMLRDFVKVLHEDKVEVDGEFTYQYWLGKPTQKVVDAIGKCP